MRSQVRQMSDSTGSRWEVLAFVCPACIEMLGGIGLHMLPIGDGVPDGRPSWVFDGNLDAPTLDPSILTYGRSGTNDRCHSYIRAGVIEYLGDSTHSLAGQHVPLPDLPDWFTKEN